MKLNFISKFSPEEAAGLYIDHKVWKRHSADQAYLLRKMEPFVQAYPLEQRAAVKEFYLKKLKNITIQNPVKTITREDLEARIGQRLISCFADLTHTKTTYAGNMRKESWGDDAVTASWNVYEDKALCVAIDSLRADRNERKGRATNFLKCIVEVMQEAYDNPYAEITLEAWTGYNTFYRRANGAYTWGRLGFEIKDSSKDFRLHMCGTDQPAFVSYRYRLMRELNSAREEVVAFELGCPRISDKEFYQRIAEAKQKLATCTTPWEIAELKVQGYPIGEYLMRNCDSARYMGVLYPNFARSLGMIQYQKRVKNEI